MWLANAAVPVQKIRGVNGLTSYNELRKQRGNRLRESTKGRL